MFNTFIPDTEATLFRLKSKVISFNLCSLANITNCLSTSFSFDFIWGNNTLEYFFTSFTTSNPLLPLCLLMVSLLSETIWSSLITSWGITSVLSKKPVLSKSVIRPSIRTDVSMTTAFSSSFLRFLSSSSAFDFCLTLLASCILLDCCSQKADTIFLTTSVIKFSIHCLVLIRRIGNMK